MRSKKKLSTLLILFLLFWNSLNALSVDNEKADSTSPHIQEYLDFLDRYPSLLSHEGNHKQGEIEIILDTDTIQSIEKIQEKKWIQQGLSKEEAKKVSSVGIIEKDPYWVWIRDAVLFPSGVFGTYNRIIWTSSLEGKAPGSIVFPVTHDGRVLLNLNYRHATRSWEVELPKGLRQEGESSIEAAIREAKEETGFLIEDIVLLGNLAINSGFSNSVVPVFFCKASKQTYASQDDSEAILTHLFLTKKEIEQAFLSGHLTLQDKEGKEIKIPFRDPSLAFAISIAEKKGLF